MSCHRDKRSSAGEKRFRSVLLRDEGSGRMNFCHAWTSDVGNIECGNEMFIRCGVEGEAGGAGPPGEGSDKHSSGC